MCGDEGCLCGNVLAKWLATSLSILTLLWSNVLLFCKILSKSVPDGFTLSDVTTPLLNLVGKKIYRLLSEIWDAIKSDSNSFQGHLLE